MANTRPIKAGMVNTIEIRGWIDPHKSRPEYRPGMAEAVIDIINSDDIDKIAILILFFQDALLHSFLYPQL